MFTWSSLTFRRRKLMNDFSFCFRDSLKKIMGVYDNSVSCKIAKGLQMFFKNVTTNKNGKVNSGKCSTKSLMDTMSENSVYVGARCNFAVELSILVRWVFGSILHGGAIELFFVPASAPRLV